MLSTKTKNAHIPLVSRNNNVIHPVAKERDLVMFDSFNFSEKNSMASCIKANPKNKTNGQDKKFILTAIVSGDNQDPLNTDPKLNQKAIKECRKNGIDPATPTFHQINPKFSATTFGIYKYSWLASQAVEYGINDN